MKETTNTASGSLKNPGTIKGNSSTAEPEEIVGDSTVGEETGTSIDLEEPIRDNPRRECIYYLADYENATAAAKVDGDKEKVRVYGMLSTLCSFDCQFWKNGEPFGKIRLSQDLAGVSVEHLPQDWYPKIQRMAAEISDPTLSARLFDIHWLGVKDHLSCRSAVGSYIASAQDLDHTDEWFLAVQYFLRACQLANKMGPRKDLAVEAREALQAALKDSYESDEHTRNARLLEAAFAGGVEDAEELAELAAEMGQKSFDAGALEDAFAIWTSEAKFWGLADDKEAGTSAAIKAANVHVTRARRRAAPGGFQAAAHIMGEAIIALRRAGETEEVIKTYRKELRGFQIKIKDELTTGGQTVNIENEVMNIRNAFNKLTFKDAVRLLCSGHPLANLTELREQTEQQLSQSLSQFFTTSQHAEDGRVVNRPKSLIGLEGEERDKALEAEMIASLHRFGWQWRADTFINPARVKISEEHRLFKEDLLFLVSNNPFVPSGHEEIFLRGLHAGFHGDFLTAALFLTPQIENSIRYVLEENGVDISNFKEDFTQPVKILGGLFDVPEMKEIFGESCWFELRGLLIEKTGPELRNRVAHGFVSSSECYGPAAVNVWWIVLRLCLAAGMVSTRSENSDPEDTDKPSPTT